MRRLTSADRLNSNRFARYPGMGMLILAMLAIPLLTPAAINADEQEDSRSASQIVEDLKENLDLTSRQLDKISPLVEKCTSERDEIRNRYREDTETNLIIRGAKRHRRQRDMEKELRSILTVEQMEKYHRMHRIHRPHRGDEHQGLMITRFDYLWDRLELTDQQAEKVIPILAENAAGIRGRLESMRGSRRGFRGREMHRRPGGMFRERMKETAEKLEPILSDEQMDELEEIVKERGEAFRERRAGRDRSSSHHRRHHHW